MPEYQYVARTMSGSRVEGRLSGASEAAAIAELQGRQLVPVEVAEASPRRRKRQRISTRDLATQYRQLSDLLRAGVPLLRALRLLGRGKSHVRLAEVMQEISNEVADGSRLGDAMARRGEVFPDVQVAMVRAGERGGFLDQVLARLGSFLEHQADMRGRVMGSLIYPLTILGLGACVLLGFLIFFVPKFRPYYAHIQVPLPTQIVLGLSDAVLHGWGWVIAGGVIVVAGGMRLMKRKDVRAWAAEKKHKVWVLGPLTRSLAVERFARILGTLLENGIPLLEAMKIARDASGDALMAKAIEEATEAVRTGESLAKPLSESGLIEEDVIEMIRVGEAANNIAEVLQTTATTIEKRVDRQLAILLRMLEPALLLVLAGMILFMFVALIVPMMRMSAAIGAGSGH